jgi:hypothetical protein
MTINGPSTWLRAAGIAALLAANYSITSEAQVLPCRDCIWCGDVSCCTGSTSGYSSCDANQASACVVGNALDPIRWTV